MELTMKTKTILSLFAATTLLSFSTMSLADHQNSAFDTDGDGVVSSEEALAAKTSYFEAADVDDSANLTLAEFVNMQSSMQADKISAAFTEADTDSSSGISLAEFTVNISTDNEDKVSQMGNIFTLADANGDSELSLAEVTDLKASGNNGVMAFAKMDADYDQLLTLEEVTATSTRASKGGSKSTSKGGRR